MVRKRVEIKRIEDNSKRQVTFTKRRQGLFKKAGELCKKCDAEIAVMAISAAGNFYAFGNPTFESVIKRYMAVKAQKIDSSEALGLMDGSPDEEQEGNAQAAEGDIGLDLNLAPLRETTTTQKIHSEKDLVLEDDQNQEKYGKVERMALWDLAVDELNGDELQQLIARMEEMKRRVVDRSKEILGL